MQVIGAFLTTTNWPQKLSYCQSVRTMLHGRPRAIESVKVEDNLRRASNARREVGSSNMNQ
jgi:hypothetical protein